MNTIKLKVDGMKCEGCEKRIKNALELLEYVEEITCSHNKSEVIINATDEVNEEEIKETIEDLGFEIKED